MYASAIGDRGSLPGPGDSLRPNLGGDSVRGILSGGFGPGELLRPDTLIGC